MKLKLYLTLNYVKYIVILLFVFVLIIWLAQILRMLDFNQTFSIQLYEIIKITSYLLPSAINTILPIIILLSSCFYNRHINSTSEISIFTLYLGKKQIYNFLTYTYLLLIILFIFNSEYLSVKSYDNFKNEEINFRNEFKISEINKEISIPNKLNLFFAEKVKGSNKYLDVTTFLIEKNIVIKSESVEYTISNSDLNFIFNNGQRISASNEEKSFTNFNKLEYKIENQNNHEVSYGKENYNFFELINSNEESYQKFAHRRIIDLFFLIFVIIISSKILFLNSKSKDLFKNYAFNLIVTLFSFTVLAFITKQLLNNSILINTYYVCSLVLLIFTGIIVMRKYAFL
ncbi:LptF/LptG family permease [Alphaproteobacteria bacterium]|nr:LptF/LptG family permease [Alphaproteobacteria bacterium]